MLITSYAHGYLAVQNGEPKFIVEPLDGNIIRITPLNWCQKYRRGMHPLVRKVLERIK